MKAKLDAQFCNSATCPPGKKKETYWCTSIAGFTLSVRSSGSATYALRYVDQHGTQREHKIGLRGEISFDQAKKVAQRLRSQVVLGNNPAVEKAEKKAVPTYAELARQHLEFARSHLRSHANIEVIQRLHLLPRWGKLRLTDIKSQDIALWLAEKREEGLAPATVEKIRVTMNRSFELARRWTIPGSEINPVKGVPRPRFNNKRERFLTPAEIERLKVAVEASDNPQLKHIVGLLLLTGARKMELLKARWEHVDMERRTWLIPDSKTGKARYVPLSQAALDIIARLPRWDNVPWLIANPNTRKPYVSIKRAWDTARKAAGLPDFRLHDSRHTAASLMIGAGIDLYAVGKVLGHADYQSTVRYSHLANDRLLAAVEAGAASMKIDWAGSSANSSHP